MTDLATLANLAELFGAAVVVGGIYEWFQWLADRLQELPDFRTGPPAYVAQRDWKP